MKTITETMYLKEQLRQAEQSYEDARCDGDSELMDMATEAIEEIEEQLK